MTYEVDLARGLKDVFLFYFLLFPLSVLQMSYKGYADNWNLDRRFSLASAKTHSDFSYFS